MPQNLRFLKHRLLGLHLTFLIQKAWSRTQEFAFSTSSQVMLMLLVLETTAVNRQIKNAGYGIQVHSLNPGCITLNKLLIIITPVYSPTDWNQQQCLPVIMGIKWDNACKAIAQFLAQSKHMMNVNYWYYFILVVPKYQFSDKYFCVKKKEIFTHINDSIKLQNVFSWELFFYPTITFFLIFSVEIYLCLWK